MNYLFQICRCISLVGMLSATTLSHGKAAAMKSSNGKTRKTHVTSADIINLDKAYEIVTKEGFAATWTTAELKNDGYWHIHGFAKSAMAPKYYVLDGKSGKIIYKNDSADTEKVPDAYRNAGVLEHYRKTSGSVPPSWTQIPIEQLKQ